MNDAKMELNKQLLRIAGLASRIARRNNRIEILPAWEREEKLRALSINDLISAVESLSPEVRHLLELVVE